MSQRSYRPMIAKSRKRQGLTGLASDAMVQAMKASQAKLEGDLHLLNMAIKPQSDGVPFMTGMRNHLERMMAMNPKAITKKAEQLGYDDLETKAIKPQKPAIMAEAIPQRKDVAVASVAPAGKVVVATVVTEKPARQKAKKPSKPATVQVPNGDFCSYLEDYAKSKSHSKTQSLYDYVNKRYQAGEVWNPNTKRFVKRR